MMAGNYMVIVEGKRSGGGKWLRRNGKNTGPELTSVGEVTLPFPVCVISTSFSSLGLSFLSMNTDLSVTVFISEGL